MKSLIIANWKMNPENAKEAKAIFDAIKKGSASARKAVDVVICPPYVYLPLLRGLTLGAQDCFWEEKGPYTGEISASMLKNMDIKYVILGHSERRKNFKEIDAEINKKVKRVAGLSLSPVLCVGETKEEKEQGKKSQIIINQLEKGLEKVTREQAKNLIIAYEPVWAIGTGDNCSADETMSSILLIRQTLFKIYNREIADKIKILYGGSVNGKNSEKYIKEAGANGLLVGGASLNADEFVKIIKSAV